MWGLRSGAATEGENSAVGDGGPMEKGKSKKDTIKREVFDGRETRKR